MTHADIGASGAALRFENNFDRAEALEVAAQLVGAASGAGLASLPADFDPALSYGQTRSVFDSEFERRYVSWLLERHHGNISAASREARMDRKHLHDLAKKHGLRELRANGRR